MKKFSTFVNEAKKSLLEIQDDTIDYISVADLKKYLQVADKFLSDETKEVIQYLIVNNANYIKDLGGKGTSENALADFYNNGPYKEPDKKELYALIGKINKSGRLLEIPVFQTKDQFEEIISGKIAADEVIIDLTSEAGRARVAQKYQGLCYKMARSFKGKSNISMEDLLSSAYEGLTHAMNSYGKKSVKAIKKEQSTGEELDITSYKTTTFLSFAAHIIRFVILEAIKNESHLVRIPTSQQAAERKEKGHNTKNTSISGDKSVNGEEGGKSLFDFVGGTENAGRSLDDEDIDRTWAILLKELKKNPKITDVMLKCWMQFNQIGGTEKKKNKEIAAELGIVPSNVTYYCYVINNQIAKDPKLSKIARELITLYNEALQRSYEDDRDEPAHVKINENNGEIEEA